MPQEQMYKVLDRFKIPYVLETITQDQYDKLGAYFQSWYVPIHPENETIDDISHLFNRSENKN